MDLALSWHRSVDLGASEAEPLLRSREGKKNPVTALIAAVGAY